MDMLEDYLRALSRLLPPAKRDDIIAELRDEILTRIEARESELGRALTDDETEAVLREVGHPIVVAARYRDEPQHIVGPALYPYWIFGVKLAVALQIAVSVLVFFGRVIGGAPAGEAFGTAIGSGVTGVMTLIGFATVAAWLVERKTIKIDYLNNWRVRDLRFLDFAFWNWSDFNTWIRTMSTSKTYDGRDDLGLDSFGRGWSPRESTAGRGVAAITMGVVLSLWWMGVVSFGLKPIPVDFAALHVNPGALGDIDFAAFKAALFWPVLVWFVGLVGYGIVVLAIPRNVRLRGVMDMALGGASASLAAWVWFASPVAEAVQVHSVQAFFDRIGAFFANPMPLPLETFATFFLVMVFFSGLFRALGGVWEFLSGAPRYADDERA